MSYGTKFADATTYEGDAILNSLGVNGYVYGRLCRDIIEKANDKNLKEFIDSKVNMNVGEIFVTDAGELNCKKIIHVVTPFKKYDPNNCLLKSVYYSAIETAVKHGFKKLGLPFIGTGANGYSESDSYEAANAACAEYEEQLDGSKAEMEITIIAYLKKKPLIHEFRNVRNKDYELPIRYSVRLKFDEFDDVCKCPAPVASVPTVSYEERDIYNCLKTMGEIDKEEFFDVDINNVRVPYDYVDEYIRIKDINEKVLSLAGLCKSKKYNLRRQITINKIDIYRLAFVLKMNKTETLEFMSVCGVCFSPISKLDLFFIKYLNGQLRKAKNLYELNELGEEVYGISFDFPYGEK